MQHKTDGMSSEQEAINELYSLYGSGDSADFYDGLAELYQEWVAADAKDAARMRDRARKYRENNHELYMLLMDTISKTLDTLRENAAEASRCRQQAKAIRESKDRTRSSAPTS